MTSQGVGDPLAGTAFRWHLRQLAAHRELLWALVSRDVRSRYKQTALGFTWAIVNPVAQMAVFTVVFSMIVRVPTGGAAYPIFAFAGILPWTLFSGGVSSATASLVAHQSLITKVAFPREVLPLAAVLARTVDFLIACTVLAAMMVAYRVAVTPALLLAPLVLLIQLVLMFGLALLLSAINLFYRDVAHAINLLLMLWMYSTPVIYPETLVPAAYRWVYMANPMAAIVSSYRCLVIDGRLPDFGLLAVASAESFSLLAVAFVLFKKWEPLYADMI